MSIFEFVLIPFGLVVAFAVAELMSSWARILRTWERYTHPWLYLSLSFWMVSNLMGHFSGLWSYRNIEFGGGTIMLVLLPAFLFSIAMTLFALDPRSDETDLEKVYFQTVGKVVVLLTVGIVVSSLSDFLPGVLEAPPLAGIASQVVALAALLCTRNRRAHALIHAALWAGAVIYLLIAENQL